MTIPYYNSEEIDMNFSPKDVITFVEENDVKFIRLTFCDMFGNLKNIAIMPSELPKAFEKGIAFDSWAITGTHSDLLLFPDASTLSVLPWRPKTGRVVRFFCFIKNPDGSDFRGDVRNELRKTVEFYKKSGYFCEIGTECEFYLFDRDEYGEPTMIPHDKAGYLDVAPLDKCENVRREICLSLDEMGFKPQSSRHKYGHGQNEIDFSKSNVLTAADNLVHFKSAVKTIAAQNGLYASFMPKPLDDKCASGMHINFYIKKNGKNIFSGGSNGLPEEGRNFIAGVLNRVKEMALFMNATTNSYKRFGMGLAPKYISWSYDDRSSLIRVPLLNEEDSRAEIRSADASCNPYITFILLLKAGFEGIFNKAELSDSLFGYKENVSGNLPENLEEAFELASKSDFVSEAFSPDLLKMIYGYFSDVISRYNYADDKDVFEKEFYFLEI